MQNLILMSIKIELVSGNLIFSHSKSLVSLSSTMTSGCVETASKGEENFRCFGIGTFLLECFVVLMSDQISSDALFFSS